MQLPKIGFDTNYLSDLLIDPNKTKIFKECCGKNFSANVTSEVLNQLYSGNEEQVVERLYQFSQIYKEKDMTILDQLTNCLNKERKRRKNLSPKTIDSLKKEKLLKILGDKSIFRSARSDSSEEISKSVKNILDLRSSDIQLKNYLNRKPIKIDAESLLDNLTYQIIRKYINSISFAFTSLPIKSTKNARWILQGSSKPISKLWLALMFIRMINFSTKTGHAKLKRSFSPRKGDYADLIILTLHSNCEYIVTSDKTMIELANYLRLTISYKPKLISACEFESNFLI